MPYLMGGLTLKLLSYLESSVQCDVCIPYIVMGDIISYMDL